MRRIFIVLVCVLLTLVLVGCETVKGMGKDIENTGRNIQGWFKKDKK